MHIIDNLEKKIQKLEKYVDVKNDNLSKVLKFFFDDMTALNMAGFAKTEQAKIFEKAFGREIIYITYLSNYNHINKAKNSMKIELDNSLDSSSENRLKDEDKKAVSDDSKIETKEEIRVRRNKALDNLENNDEIASEFDEFK